MKRLEVIHSKVNITKSLSQYLIKANREWYIHYLQSILLKCAYKVMCYFGSMLFVKSVWTQWDIIWLEKVLTHLK